MKRKVVQSTLEKIILTAFVLVVYFVAVQPFISVSIDDFGIAVSTRQSEQYKFHPLFILEW